MDVFRDAGYEPLAPGWPGTPDSVEAARTSPESVAGKGIDDVVDHYAEIIRELPASPDREFHLWPNSWRVAAQTYRYMVPPNLLPRHALAQSSALAPREPASHANAILDDFGEF